MEDYRAAAEYFIEHETQFHLGFLPTEQSNPLTRHVDREFETSTAAGVRNLQQVDRNVLAMAEKVALSQEYAALLETGCRTVREGGRIVFSGCGATGRLSILLEAMWREACFAHGQEAFLDSVKSIMTGGDYALVKSVEFFEDYAVFGARQVREMELSDRDLLVAITEGGETSSVLGTVEEAVRRGARTFLFFNNPARLLTRIARSKAAIENPAVTVLDLACGPMAIAGSTRMQATTSEQLFASAALEHIFNAEVLKRTSDFNPVGGFRRLLTSLESAAAVGRLAEYIDFELEVYQSGGKVTYFADDYMLDIFTDTTERSPTFMLPPFRKIDDHVSPVSWAFARNPLYGTPEAIRRALGRREPRCLAWMPADYREMRVPAQLAAAPPAIDRAELEKLPVGNEPLPERSGGRYDAAVLFTVGAPSPELQAAFDRAAEPFAQRRALRISPAPDGEGIALDCVASSLKVFEHLGVKLALNTVSTGAMVKYGRVSGNWMAYVAVSNKKLIDRAIRLLAELTGLEYRDAAVEIFRARNEIAELPPSAEIPSAVQYALSRVRPRRG